MVPATACRYSGRMYLDRSEPLLFQALLTPHRSLSKRGAWRIIVSLLAASLLLSLRFWLVGAWPVVVFSLIDVPLVGLLLVISFRQARASECVMLSREALTVIRTGADGARLCLSLPTAWLRVELRDGEDAPRVVAFSRGRSVEIAAFLPSADKRALYEALGRALHDVRYPVFDNPQLREG
jgi:uncharacterized membrane protein